MNRVAICGGAGMLGTAVVRVLRERFPSLNIRASYHSHAPYILDPGVEWIQCDLRAPEECDRFLSGCDSVVIASVVSAGAAATISGPWTQVSENARMYSSLLSSCAGNSLSRVIFVGSASVYPESEIAITEEDLDLNIEPPEPYRGIGWTMRYAEKLCGLLQSTRGTSTTVLRAANIYGPGARFDPATSNFIPALIRKATQRHDPFEVWGSPDVERDVLYVDDAAEAIARILSMSDTQSDVLNMGSGVGIRMDEAVRYVLSATQFAPGTISFAEDRPVTVRRRVLDVSRIKQRLDWQPRVSIQNGIAMTAAWWRQHAERWSR